MHIKGLYIRAKSINTWCPVRIMNINKKVTSGMQNEKGVDEADLAFRATLDLSATDDNAANFLPSDQQENRHHYVKEFRCYRNTLLVRLAVFVFFVVLVTLLETLQPGKAGILTATL